jgi:hypothetical protein
MKSSAFTCSTCSLRSSPMRPVYDSGCKVVEACMLQTSVPLPHWMEEVR